MKSSNDPAGLKVLIVDDEPINLVVLEAVCSKLGMRVIKAQGGRAALEAYQAELPDIVLMDVLMPDMDGIEATREIKRISGDRWVPVVMVTALYSREDIVRGLEGGADDYLIKPVDYRILRTKIANLALVISQQKALRKYYERTEMESQLAIEVMNKLIRTSQLGDKLQYWLNPTAQFSGDVIVAGTTPEGITQAILADGTGHGLAAALNVIPVVEVFYGMNDKGFPIDAISQELNARIRKVIPTGRFVAAALISMDASNRTIRVWNGGIPFVAFIGKNGEVLRQWRSKQPPLGLLDEKEFEHAAESYCCTQDGFLFACSDGLLEAENAAGVAVGEARLLEWLKSNGGDRIGSIVAQLESYLEGKSAHDDVSFLVAPFPSR